MYHHASAAVSVCIISCSVAAVHLLCPLYLLIYIQITKSIPNELVRQLKQSSSQVLLLLLLMLQAGSLFATSQVSRKTCGHSLQMGHCLLFQCSGYLWGQQAAGACPSK